MHVLKPLITHGTPSPQVLVSYIVRSSKPSCPALNFPAKQVPTIKQNVVLQGERALQMDVQEGSRLQLQAFEAINEVVRSASSDTLPLVGQLIQALLDKLGSTLRMQVTSSETREHQNDLQVLFCSSHMHLFTIYLLVLCSTCHGHRLYAHAPKTMYQTCAAALLFSACNDSIL